MVRAKSNITINKEENQIGGYLRYVPIRNFLGRVPKRIRIKQATQVSETIIAYLNREGQCSESPDHQYSNPSNCLSKTRISTIHRAERSERSAHRRKIGFRARGVI
jgi:hypothetical protein